MHPATVVSLGNAQVIREAKSKLLLDIPGARRVMWVPKSAIPLWALRPLLEAGKETRELVVFERWLGDENPRVRTSR